MFVISKKGMVQVALCLMAMDMVHQLKIMNTKEKNQIVQLLSQIVYNSTGDADTMIAKCALDFASQVIAVSHYNDILVLLVYHWKMDMSTIY